MNIGLFFNIILIWPLTNILIAIYQGLSFLHIPFGLGFAIIGLTVLIRLALYPLFASQLKHQKKMQALTPHLNHVKQKHKGDAKKIQEESMRVYKEHGVNPAAGCLPSLLQLPVVYCLYIVFQQVIRGNNISAINKVLYFKSLHLTSSLDLNFFGLMLGKSPSSLFSHGMPLILLVPILTAAFQLIQSKMMFSTPAALPVIVDKKKNNKDEKKEEKKDDDFAAAMQTQTTYIFPLVIGWLTFNFPLGLSLYWNTTTIFGIIQQYQISGLGGLKEWVDKIKVLLKKSSSTHNS